LIAPTCQTSEHQQIYIAHIEFRVVALTCPGFKRAQIYSYKIFYCDTPLYWIFNSHLNTDRENTILPKSLSNFGSIMQTSIQFYGQENTSTLPFLRHWKHQTENQSKIYENLKKKKDYMAGCQANLI